MALRAPWSFAAKGRSDKGLTCVTLCASIAFVVTLKEAGGGTPPQLAGETPALQPAVGQVHGFFDNLNSLFG